MEAGSVRHPSTQTPARPAPRSRRLVTETKGALKTTEFWAMVGVIAAILVSAAVISGGDTGGTDEFIARNAWLYVSIVAAAYIVSRGLANGLEQRHAVEPRHADVGQQHVDVFARDQVTH